MDSRLKDLYGLADQQHLAQLYLRELSEQCANLELRVMEIAEALPDEQREILECYMDLRNELEYQSVKVAMKVAKGKS